MKWRIIKFVGAIFFLCVNLPSFPFHFVHASSPADKGPPSGSFNISFPPALATVQLPKFSEQSWTQSFDLFSSSAFRVAGTLDLNCATAEATNDFSSIRPGADAAVIRFCLENGLGGRGSASCRALRDSDNRQIVRSDRRQSA